MHPTLKKALEKLGLSSYNELNDLEKETFKTWEKVLSGKKITQEDVIEEIKKFQEKILTDVCEPEASEKKKAYLLAQLDVVRFILRTIESPKAEVRRVEQEVENLSTGRTL